jgi:hypothetical protein
LAKKIITLIISVCILLTSTTVFAMPNAVPPPGEEHENRVILPWDGPEYESSANLEENTTANTEAINSLQNNIENLNLRMALQFVLLTLFVLCIVFLVIKKQTKKEPVGADSISAQDNITETVVETTDTVGAGGLRRPN